MIEIRNKPVAESLERERERSFVEKVGDERQIRQRLLKDMRGGKPPKHSDAVGLLKRAIHFRILDGHSTCSSTMFERMDAKRRRQQQRLSSLGMTEEEFRQETGELIDLFAKYKTGTKR